MPGGKRVSQTHLGRAVPELRGDECRFHRPRDNNCKRYGDNRPEYRVHPKWRLEPEFDPESQYEHDCAQHYDDADRACVASVGLPKVQPAYLALRLQGQKSCE